MKRWMVMLTALLCVLVLTACGTQPPEEPSEPERNMVTITVPADVTQAEVLVPDGRDRYLWRYTGEDKIASLVDLLKQVGERPEYPPDAPAFAGHVYEITLLCADGSKEEYFWSGSYVQQGDDLWCELPYEKEGWLEPWLEKHEPDEITKLN